MAEWMGLIGALAGTGIGGFVTYKVSAQSHKYLRQDEEERRLRLTCESIHELLSRISTQASTLSMGVIGQLGYGSPIKGDILKEQIQLDRLRMLVDFYAPSLQDDVKSMSEHLAIIGLAVGEVMLQKNPTDAFKTKTVGDAAIASAKLTEIASKAQQKLAGLVRASIGSS